MPQVIQYYIKRKDAYGGGYVADNTTTPIEMTPDINLAKFWENNQAGRDAALAVLGNNFEGGSRPKP
mgnify:CR=1 FL=1